MYEQRITFNFVGDKPHAQRLALVAELAQRHPRYFWYKIEHSYAAHRCTLICLAPDVWTDVLAYVQTAQTQGLALIVSAAP